MATIFLGSEAIDRNEVTWGQLRWKYRAIYPDVYTPRIAEPSLYTNTVGAWLWSGRKAPVTGRAASALHGSLWVDETAAIELLWPNNRPPSGIITRNDHFASDDVIELHGVAVATPQRAAYDLGRYLPRDVAVAHLDALSRATGLAAEDVASLIARHKGARGIRQLRTAIDLMDGGAQSPKETWLRLLLTDAGYPRPTTQIPVIDDWGHTFAYLDMGWDDVMIAVEYDGDQHRTDRIRYAWDVKRLRPCDRSAGITSRSSPRIGLATSWPGSQRLGPRAETAVVVVDGRPQRPHALSRRAPARD
jgi:hypothetical protein